MTAPRFVSILCIGTAVAISAAACHKKMPPAATTAPAPPPAAAAARPATPPAPPPPPAATPAPTPTPLTEDEIFARKSLDQLNSERPLGDVFFDLDKSDVRDEARSILQRDADWMKRWTS